MGGAAEYGSEPSDTFDEVPLRRARFEGTGTSDERIMSHAGARTQKLASRPLSYWFQPADENESSWGWERGRRGEERFSCELD